MNKSEVRILAVLEVEKKILHKTFNEMKPKSCDKPTNVKKKIEIATIISLYHSLSHIYTQRIDTLLQSQSAEIRATAICKI